MLKSRRGMNTTSDPTTRHKALQKALRVSRMSMQSCSQTARFDPSAVTLEGGRKVRTDSAAVRARVGTRQPVLDLCLAQGFAQSHAIPIGREPPGANGGFAVSANRFDRDERPAVGAEHVLMAMHEAFRHPGTKCRWRDSRA